MWAFELTLSMSFEVLVGRYLSYSAIYSYYTATRGAAKSPSSTPIYRTSRSNKRCYTDEAWVTPLHTRGNSALGAAHVSDVDLCAWFRGVLAFFVVT